MRPTLRAAACLAAVVLSSVAPPAHADPSFCSQPGTCSPNAHCHVGEPITVVVVGVGDVKGLAACGNGLGSTQYVRCEGFGFCTNTETAVDDGSFGCDVQTLDSVAVCTAGVGITVQPIDDALKLLDPTFCALFITAAPTVDGLPGGLVYIDQTGDTYVPGTPDPNNLFWDCPPYSI